MSRICPNCQSANPDSAKFCHGCGNGFQPAAVPACAATSGLSTKTQVLLNSKTQVRPMTALTARGQTGQSTQVQVASTRRERVIYVVDVSGSMADLYDATYSKIESAIRAGMSMVIKKKRVDSLDEVGVVSFNDRATVIIAPMPAGTHRPQIIQALQLLNADGGTDINEGLMAAESLFDWSRSDVTNRIILLTDGQGGYPLETAADLKHRGVIIQVIGVGDSPAGVDERLLKQVASTLNGELQYRFIKDLKELVTGVTDLANKTVIVP